jgi:hypothetical protein
MRAGSVPSTRGAPSHRAAGRRHSSASLAHHPNASKTSSGTSRGKGGVASIVTDAARRTSPQAEAAFDEARTEFTST